MFKTYMEKNIKLSIKDRKVGLKNVNTSLFSEIYTKVVRVKNHVCRINAHIIYLKRMKTKLLINQIGQNITEDMLQCKLL